jgi:hypothetical protein
MQPGKAEPDTTLEPVKTNRVDGRWLRPPTRGLLVVNHEAIIENLHTTTRTAASVRRQA